MTKRCLGDACESSLLLCGHMVNSLTGSHKPWFKEQSIPQTKEWTANTIAHASYTGLYCLKHRGFRGVMADRVELTIRTLLHARIL